LLLHAGVAVTIICPGFIRTGMVEAKVEQFKQNLPGLMTAPQVFGLNPHHLAVADSAFI
jgi:short-subunit dehydrogenase